MKHTIWIAVLLSFFLTSATVALAEKGKIVQDTEYYILEAQNTEKWAADDKDVDEKLAEFTKKE